MVKYSRTRKCDLCGINYAVLNSTWHVSKSYRLHYCKRCTDMLLIAVEKLKKVLKP